LTDVTKLSRRLDSSEELTFIPLSAWITSNPGSLSVRQLSTRYNRLARLRGEVISGLICSDHQLQYLANENPQYCDVYIHDTDIGLWKVIMEAVLATSRKQLLTGSHLPGCTRAGRTKSCLRWTNTTQQLIRALGSSRQFSIPTFFRPEEFVTVFLSVRNPLALLTLRPRCSNSGHNTVRYTRLYPRDTIFARR
jgi:hypothetical protein